MANQQQILLNKELKNGLKYFNDDINVNEFIEIFNNVNKKQLFVRDNKIFFIFRN